MEWIILFVGIISLLIILQLMWGNSRRSRARSNHEADEALLPGFPYAMRPQLLTAAELNFFQSLRNVVGDRAIVCVKVGLGDVFNIRQEAKDQYRSYRNKIDRKHVDFLLCDPITMSPLAGIELDDRSHQRDDRMARDEFVDSVFDAAGLPLLHVPVKRAYVAAEVEAQIAPFLGVGTVSAPTPVRNPEPPAQIAAAVSESPRCPKCGSEMILRTVRSGANAGNQFWGCSRYPDCRGMVASSKP